MTKMYCDKCKKEIKEYAFTMFHEGEFYYGLCEECDILHDQWLNTQPSCEDAIPDSLPLAEMVKRLLNDTGYSQTSKVHCCRSCENDKFYETAEITLLDLIMLQHAYIDYMEKRND